ncbi:DMT family transporter [Lysobacter sp. HA35]
MSANASATANAVPSAASWVTPLEIGVLGAIWGASFLFMRVAASEFGPAALVELRLALGAIVLMPFLWKARASFPLRMWPKLAVIGAINSAIPFLLFAWGAERAPAGVGAICNAMTVLFTALVGAMFFREKIGLARSVTLATGFAGVVVLASGRIAGADIGPAVMAGSAAALLYGVGINLVRRHLTGLPASAVAPATLLCSSILVAPFGMAQWPSRMPSAHAWLSVILLGVMCTGIAFVMYYRLIARIGAGRASTVTYLVPLFGVAWAWMLLGEVPTLRMVIAGALILGSVAMSQRAN